MKNPNSVESHITQVKGDFSSQGGEMSSLAPRPWLHGCRRQELGEAEGQA